MGTDAVYVRLIRGFTTMTLKPLGDRVLVSLLLGEKTSTGLLYYLLLDHQRGEVLAVGAEISIIQDGKTHCS